MRIDALISATHRAVAAADAANDPLRSVTAWRILRHAACEWPNVQRMHFERARVKAVLREMGVGYEHEDGGGFQKSIAGTGHSFTNTCDAREDIVLQKKTPQQIARDAKTFKKAGLDECGVCGERSAAKLKICSACRRVQFCSAACSKAGWKHHKAQCAAWCDEARVAAAAEEGDGV